MLARRLHAIDWCNAVTVGLIGFYFLYVHEHASERSNAVLLYSIQVVVGLCTSITFSSVASIIALLPDKFHYFFFMGTMCPFFIYLPVNVSTGNLCTAPTANSTNNGSLPAPQMQVWLCPRDAAPCHTPAANQRD